MIKPSQIITRSGPESGQVMQNMNRPSFTTAKQKHVSEPAATLGMDNTCWFRVWAAGAMVLLSLSQFMLNIWSSHQSETKSVWAILETILFFFFFIWRRDVSYFSFPLVAKYSNCEWSVQQDAAAIFMDTVCIQYPGFFPKPVSWILNMLFSMYSSLPVYLNNY